MMTPKILNGLLIAAVLAGTSAHASDGAIRAIEDGNTVAQFKLGDSNCELIDGQIRCPLGK